MTTAAKAKATSRLLEAVHDTATSLHTAGLIDLRRLRQFDALCLAPVPDYSAAGIKPLRARHKLSQTVLAVVLNTIGKHVPDLGPMPRRHDPP